MTETPEKPAEAGVAQPSSKSEGAPPKSEKALLKEARTQGQRSLFIMVMLMFLVSIVVFVIGTYFFMVPHVVTQDLEMRHMQLKLNSIEEVLFTPDEATEEATEEAGTPEETAPAATEVKPAPPEKKAPAKKAPEK